MDSGAEEFLRKEAKAIHLIIDPSVIPVLFVK